MRAERTVVLDQLRAFAEADMAADLASRANYLPDCTQCDDRGELSEGGLCGCPVGASLFEELTRP